MVVAGELVVGDEAGEVDVLGHPHLVGQPSQLLRGAPVADDQVRRVGHADEDLGKRPDHRVVPLVGSEPGDGEQDPLALQAVPPPQPAHHLLGRGTLEARHVDALGADEDTITSDAELLEQLRLVLAEGDQPVRRADRPAEQLAEHHPRPAAQEVQHLPTVDRLDVPRGAPGAGGGEPEGDAARPPVSHIHDVEPVSAHQAPRRTLGAHQPHQPAARRAQVHDLEARLRAGLPRRSRGRQHGDVGPAAPVLRHLEAVGADAPELRGELGREDEDSHRPAPVSPTLSTGLTAAPPLVAPPPDAHATRGRRPPSPRRGRSSATAAARPAGRAPPRGAS